MVVHLNNNEQQSCSLNVKQQTNKDLNRKQQMKADWNVRMLYLVLRKTYTSTYTLLLPDCTCVVCLLCTCLGYLPRSAAYYFSGGGVPPLR